MSEFFESVALQFGREYAADVTLDCKGQLSIDGGFGPDVEVATFAELLLNAVVGGFDVDLAGLLPVGSVPVRFTLRIGAFLLIGDSATDNQWGVVQTTVIAGIGLFDNGGVPLVSGTTLQIRGATATLLGVGGTVDGGSVLYNGPSFLGSVGVELKCAPVMQIGVFADDSLGDAPPDLTYILSATERQIAVAGGRVDLGVNIGGQPLVLTQVGQAYPRADNQYFIRATDVGVQAGQIPPTVAANTSSALRLHPSVFIRETDKIRGLVAGPSPVSPVPITTPAGAPALFDVVRSPTHSRWDIVIDSSTVSVVIAHPPGSDLRRPRDVWQTVWRRLLQSTNAKGSGIATALQSFEVVPDDPPVTNSFFSRGLVRGLRYMQCAIFREFYDADAATPIIAPHPQA